MADPILDHHPPPLPPPPSLPQNPNTSTENMAEEFNSQLPTPPLDPLFFDQNPDNFDVLDLSSNFDDISDFDITFDDLPDLYLPYENEQFLIPNNNTVNRDPGQPDNNLDLQPGPFEGCFGDFASNTVNLESTDSGGPGTCGDHGGLEVDKYLNPSPSEAESCDSGGSDYRSSVLSPVSSHGSRNSGSGVLNAGSPESGTNVNPCNFVGDKKIVETETESAKKRKSAKIAVAKRKKEMGDEENGEIIRNLKSRKAESENVSVNVSGSASLSGEEERRKTRLMRNRESAQLSRQRKKHYVEELEDKVRMMHSTIAELNGKVSYFMAENATLRQQLSGNGACPPPMYAPMAPYPWVPCAPYVVKSQGSQVPLVPIPRLKPKQTVPVAKPKKVESKKGEGKTKKVASVSLFGFLFFILLFRCLVPIVNVKFGGVGSLRKVYVGNVPFEITSERLLGFFSMYGEIEEGPLGFDKSTGKSKGFAFLIYKSEDGAKAAIADPMKNIDGHQVVCKLAVDNKRVNKTNQGSANAQNSQPLAHPSFPQPQPQNSIGGVTGSLQNYGPASNSYQLNTSLTGSGYNGAYRVPPYVGAGPNDGGLNNAGASMYRMPQSTVGTGSGVYPDAGSYALSQQQQHQQPSSMPLPPRFPHGAGGMYQGMPPPYY